MMSRSSSESAVSHAFDGNLRAFIVAAGGRPWAEVGDEADVSWLRTGLAWSWCNGIAAARFDAATAHERIEQVLAPYRARKLRVVWWVTSTSTPADLLHRLHARGLELDPPEPGMARDLEAWRAPPIPPDISVARVDDASAFHEWCAVFVAGMEVSADGMPAFEQRFADISIGEQSPLRAYLASKQGHAIASGFSILHDGVVGIYAVATLPDARRQGAGR